MPGLEVAIVCHGQVAFSLRPVNPLGETLQYLEDGLFGMVGGALQRLLDG